MKDKVENIIQTVQAKEDEIYTTLIEDHSLDLVKHDVSEMSLKIYVKSFAKGDIAIENLAVIDAKLAEIPAIDMYKTQLVALLDVQVSAYDQLLQLQQSFVQNVEDDAATRDDERTLTAKWEAFSAAKAKYGNAESDSAKLLGDQINECTSNLGNAKQTFEDYAQAQSERKEVFNNFRADANVDSLDEFKNKLIHHLSSTIVVKENRNRYQKEQFDRLLISAQARNLKNQNSSMETFCVDYSRIIEGMIDQSNNFKSPKIQANYDSFGEE